MALFLFPSPRACGRKRYYQLIYTNFHYKYQIYIRYFPRPLAGKVILTHIRF
ncbi:MAG: hypothetical protein LBR79_04785 [Oscillospiraceae bacterium]|nr:hypothetical protein [Oscillospiraceae bacterium]